LALNPGRFADFGGLDRMAEVGEAQSRTHAMQGRCRNGATRSARFDSLNDGRLPPGQPMPRIVSGRVAAVH
jgi:hypothetical protein